MSGGSANSNVNASLGGAKSSVVLVDNTIDNLFADSLGPETLAGSIKYRALYYHNAHATLTALNAKLYVTANTPSTDDTIDIAVGTAVINATEQGPVTDENTAPSGVSWSAPSTYATGLALGDIPAGQHKAFWLRRTLTGPGSAYDNDTLTFEVGVDSAQ